MSLQGFLYIDPGTGSMLFSVFIGAAMTIVFLLRALIIKFQFIITGGRAKKTSQNKIPYVIYTDSKRYWNVFKPICYLLTKFVVFCVSICQNLPTGFFCL